MTGAWYNSDTSTCSCQIDYVTWQFDGSDALDCSIYVGDCPAACSTCVSATDCTECVPNASFVSYLGSAGTCA